jgi:hypothetical protein
MQGGDRRGRDGRRLLEGQVGGLGDHGLADAHVLSEGAAAGAAEHLVTRSQVGDGAADGGNGPGQVGPGYRLLWPAQPHRRPGDVRPARHREPLRRVHRRRADAHQHAVVGEGRLRDVLELEHIR